MKIIYYHYKILKNIAVIEWLRRIQDTKNRLSRKLYKLDNAYDSCHQKNITFKYAQDMKASQKTASIIKRSGRTSKTSETITSICRPNRNYEDQKVWTEQR